MKQFRWVVGQTVVMHLKGVVKNGTKFIFICRKARLPQVARRSTSKTTHLKWFISIQSLQTLQRKEIHDPERAFTYSSKRPCHRHWLMSKSTDPFRTGSQSLTTCTHACTRRSFNRNTPSRWTRDAGPSECVSVSLALNLPHTYTHTRSRGLPSTVIIVYIFLCQSEHQ